MKPSPDRLRQIANKYAIGSRPGDRVPMRMGGRELSTETSYCTLRIDFHNTSLPEVTAGHRLLDSQLSSPLEMGWVDQECDSYESTKSGFVDCSIHSDSPPGKKWRMKRHVNGEVYVSLFECPLPEVAELANSINEPPLSISYRSTTGGDPGSQDTDLHYNTFISGPSDKSISQDSSSYEGGMAYGDGTSEPPGVRGLSLTTGNPSPPECISYPLSETLWGDHMQRVQEMESTLTISVSLGMLGMWYGKRSLSDYHSYTEDAEHHYSPPGIIFQDYAAQIQHL